MSLLYVITFTNGKKKGKEVIYVPEAVVLESLTDGPHLAAAGGEFLLNLSESIRPRLTMLKSL